MTINAILLAFIGMQFLVIARRGERWPFAPYAMYASEHGGDISWYRVYGVSAGREFPLDEPKYHPPIDDIRLSYAFTPPPSRLGTVPATASEMLPVVARLYARARRDGLHDGPPLDAIRLYQLNWTLERSLANRDTPDHKDLVAEVILDH